MSLKIYLKSSLLACKNSCFSSLLTAKDVLPAVTSVLQQQKFHTDDVTQCLHNKSGSHGVVKVNLFNFVFLLVDYAKVLCYSPNKLWQKSNAFSKEGYIPRILMVL